MAARRPNCTEIIQLNCCGHLKFLNHHQMVFRLYKEAIIMSLNRLMRKKPSHFGAERNFKVSQYLGTIFYLP